MYSSAYVWGKVQGYLETRLGPDVINTYFDEVDVVELTESKLVLCASPFCKNIILEKFSDYLRDALKELFAWNVELLVLDHDEKKAYRGDAQVRDLLSANPQYTFEKFVVGSSNRFAHAAALAVANKPSEAYNPLFIHGPSGLGKTHLLYAIANQIRTTHPEFKIVYVKGDQFTNELITAIQQGKNVEFRNKYRGADLFLVDDVQFIAGKESSQEEFFHTFNNLYEAHKQIVLTSDRPPKEMDTLEDRLRTRFEWGLIADIKPPDYETRMAIIRSKLKERNLFLEDDVCNYLAENITNNIRQMEGAVNRLISQRELNGVELTLPNVSRMLSDIYKGPADTLPSASLIITETARYFNLTENQLRGTQKLKGIAEARQMAMYLCRTMTNLSLPDIGKEFGRDHSTVIYSVRKVVDLVDRGDSATMNKIRDISTKINSRL